MKTSSGPAGDTRMKRHSPVFKELTILVMSERRENSPVSKLTALVEMCTRYSESFEKINLSFPGRVREGCIEEVVFKLRLGG